MTTSIHRAAAAAFATALLLVAPAAAAAKPSKQVTVDASTQVRLYEQDFALYAKAKGIPRYRLGRGIAGLPRNESTVHHAVVSGRYVAFAVGRDGPDFRADTIYVRDVPKRRFVAQVEPIVPEAGYEPGDGREVLALEVTRHGDAAWVAQYSHGDQALLRRQVVLLERGHSAQLVDSEGSADPGSGIDPFSLALSQRRFDASRLFWQHGAAARSVTF